ncbi:MAG: hypothetical protein FWB94_10745 [Chitinispirillia bacterium]|nr:hypothetical protein [Chitinispirillia bacterium]
MSSYAIAVFVKYFNISATLIVAFFAICGVFALVRRNASPNIFRGRAFVQGFCVAALAAFAIEATVFNFPYYLKYFAGPELHTTELSPDAPGVILTSDGTRAELVFEEGSGGAKFPGVVFSGLDRSVTSVFSALDFGGYEMAVMSVSWTDEESTRGFSRLLYKHLPHENYTPLQPCGSVSELRVVFRPFGLAENPETSKFGMLQVAVNKRIPLYFSGIRLLALSILFFAAVLLFHKKLRARAAWFLLEYRFDPASRKQALIYASAVVLLILFSWVCVYTSVGKIHSNEVYQQYNKFLVDALMDGKVYLDNGTPEKLLNEERPYDFNLMHAKGYAGPGGVMFDWAWYKGKHYCYFGVAPAVLLFVPYRLVTGSYLSNHAGVFLFSAIVVVLLAALWRFCVRKYMPDSRFAFFLLSFVTLYFASGLVGVLRFPLHYTMIQAAALMFSCAGVLLLLKSTENEKINRLKLFFACLCLALVAGCRPTLIFVSLFVPVILWKRRSWKLLMLVAVPYIMVAIPLCIYNYVRFDSVFEFGARYNWTIINVDAYGHINPIGKIIRFFVSSALYLFLPYRYSLYFPYVEYAPSLSGMLFGSRLINEGGGGLINFPIVFCLFYLFRNIFNKNMPKAFYVLLVSMVVAVITIMAGSLVIGYIWRYTVDFAVYIIFPALFCAFYWCNDIHSVHQDKTRLKVVYFLLVVSTFVGLLAFVSGSSASPTHSDPVLYRYLQYSLGLIRVY